MTLFYIMSKCKLLYLIRNKSTRNWLQKRKPQQKRKLPALARKQKHPQKQKNQLLVDIQLTLQDARKQLSRYLVKNQLPQAK